MAELRRAEEAVRGLRQTYQALYRGIGDEAATWPALSANDDEKGKEVPHNTNSMNNEPPPTTPTTMTATAVVQQLDTLRQQLRDTLQPLMIKFAKRLQEKDLVTDKPRYGAKTQQRVTVLLRHYHELDDALTILYGEAVDNSTDGNSIENTTSATDTAKKNHHPPMATWQQRAADEAFQQQQAEQARQEAKARAAAAVKQERIAQAAAEQAAQQAAAAEEQRQRQLMATQARQAMEAQRRAAAAAARADQEWQDGIPKGVDGVRQELSKLLAATVAEPLAQRTAVQALHRMFQQIVARPEEVNFRRIRRGHAQFEQDIGRHPGGKEILIAAGFRLGAIDDVPSFISTEPDLETDMDAWGDWFDLLKNTLAIMEEAMIKLK